MENKGNRGEIIVITVGDSNSVDTWSNVPYFFTNTLEKKGYIIHRVNIGIEGSFGKLMSRIFNKAYRSISKSKSNVIYDFMRTGMFYRMANRTMKKAVEKYPNSKLIISTNLSHSGSSVSNIKSLLFGDWTIEYYIKERLGRQPNFWEKLAIKRQDEEIEKSNYIISLFPNIYEYMKNYYKNEQIYYLGNVINSEILDIDINKLYKNRKEKNTLLFIGRKAYISSAKSLIKAVEMLNKDRDDDYFKVRIIGMSESDFEEKSEYVEYMGYLSKGNEEEKKKYYDSVLNALAVVNTTEKWSGASSMIECMYYGTPVITAPYDAFIETFGEDIEFGSYSPNTPEAIKERIERFSNLSEEEYSEVCRKSHEAVSDFTWDNYIDKVIEICDI